MQCFITYFPKGKKGFVVNYLQFGATGSPQTLTKEVVNRKIIAYPSSDNEGKWIGVAENKRLACLLSKGDGNLEEALRAIVNKFFYSPNIYHFYMNLDFKSYNPFLLIAYDDNSLFELKWDGLNHGMRNLVTSQFHLWTSSDLMESKLGEKQQRLSQQKQLNDEKTGVPVQLSEVKEIILQLTSGENEITGECISATTIMLSDEQTKLLLMNSLKNIVEESTL